MSPSEFVRKCPVDDSIMVPIDGHSVGTLHTLCTKCDVCIDCDDGAV